jgi:HK97 family phage major capsid protein
MDELKKKKIEIDTQIRKLQEDITNGVIKADDAKKKFNELRARHDQVNREIAQANVPATTRTAAPAVKTADLIQAAREKRDITLSGTGAVAQIKELAKLLQEKTPVLEKVRYFYGPNASTNIPVLNPGLASPVSAAEGATNISVDSTAALGVKSLTPKAFVSILPVSMEALTLGIVDFENELPVIFSDAFARAFHSRIVKGPGAGDFQGLFTGVPSGNLIACAQAGYPKIDDLVLLALTIQDFADDACIVLHPSIYAGVVSDDTNLNLPYREEMIRGKTIEGVPLILTSAAPSDTSAGKTVAVAGRLSDYGFAVAGEITIDPIKKVGDTNTYFQASMFANGAKIVDNNFNGLTTIAGE